MSLRRRSPSFLFASMMMGPNHVPDTTPRLQLNPPSLSQRAISQVLTSTANLANTLPTGTLLVFQFLMPMFTHHGKCEYFSTRFMTSLLLVILSVACFLSHFTDSYKSSDGQIFYGFATYTGMWLFDQRAAQASSPIPDLSRYKIGRIDWIHAILSVFVFGAFAMQDKYVISCFFPTASLEVQEFFELIPIAIGLVTSVLFIIFPSRRHGIGYPVTAGN